MLGSSQPEHSLSMFQCFVAGDVAGVQCLRMGDHPHNFKNLKHPKGCNSFSELFINNKTIIKLKGTALIYQVHISCPISPISPKQVRNLCVYSRPGDRVWPLLITQWL